MLLRSAKNWVLLRTVSGSRMATVLGSRPRPAGSGHVRISGTNPIRVLVTGGGLTVGYGVTEWEQALGAHLGRVLTEHAGRGAVVDQVPLPEVDADEVDLLISSLDGRGYDLVVWSPSFTEDAKLPAPDGWRAGARAAERALGATGCGCKGHIVLGVPELQGDGRDEQVITENIRRANRSLAEMAEAVPRTAFVAPPSLGPLDGTGPRLGPEFYSTLAERVTPVAARLLVGGGVAVA